MADRCSKMSAVTFFCGSCETAIVPDRARVRCQSCPDFDLCAECHVTRSFSEPHQAHHGYEVHRYGRKVMDVDGPAVSTAGARSGSPMPLRPVPRSPQSGDQGPGPPAPKTGNRAVAAESFSPLSRLVAAIFAHFDPVGTGVLDPSQFSALVAALGFTAADFPPLSVAASQSAALAQLHHCDAWLANWYRSFGLEFRLATRQFAPPPPVQPVNGRTRKRDELLHAMMHPPAPVVHGGMPMLPLPGLQRYFEYQAKLDAGNLFGRLMHLLTAVPTLTDSETGEPVSTKLLSAACVPPPPDPEEEQRMRWLMQSQERQAINEALRRQRNDAIINESAATARSNCTGGWKIDSSGNRVWNAGY